MACRVLFLLCTLLATFELNFAQYPAYNYTGYSSYSNYQCGPVPCPQTTIQCNGCTVPIGFSGLVTRCRSLLWRGEQILQAVGKLIFNSIGRFISGTVAIPRDFVKVIIADGEMFIRDAVIMVDWFSGSRESLEDLLNKIREQNNKAVSTPPPEDLPVFDANLVTNATAQLGGTAYLHCRVRNLNNRAVSWVRRRDWHILTSAMFTYTNDERFQVIHQEGSDDWTLQIKYVQKRDQGAYECQVATGRGTLSHFFNLVVVVPTAYILGTGEYHIGQGSTISLVCIIENSPTPPQFVMWYHNDKMISYENAADSNSAASSRQAQIVTETGAGDKTHSRLLITDATSAHSGNYTCQASNTEPDSVYVFVSSVGDNIAAIQRQDGSGGIRPCIALLIFLVILPTTLIHCNFSDPLCSRLAVNDPIRGRYLEKTNPIV